MSVDDTPFVDAALEGNAKSFADLFQNGMEDKITSLLQGYKAFVAAKIFDTSDSEDEKGSEEVESSN